MKQLVILSGKGGTGKTTITAALAHLASLERRVVLADADVDAANLELVLRPTQLEAHEFHSGQVARIDPDLCIACGRCAEVCRFDAVLDGDTYEVDPLACEGCASCFYQCPVDAIEMIEAHAGMWYRSDTRFGPLFHAHLFAGEENSGKLVMQVKQSARLMATQLDADLLLVDGPPGIGCTVIAASTGADLALLVTEPTVSGVHDLERVLATTNHFGVPAVVCINKADINLQRTAEIVQACERWGIEVVGQVPFDTVMTEAMVQGEPITTFSQNGVVAAIQELWEQLRGMV